MYNNGISLNELSKVLKVNKTKLAYYNELGLIKPETIIGRMYIFDKDKTLERLTVINKMIKRGEKLEQIAKILDKMD